jgi:alkaline phosphatase D
MGDRVEGERRAVASGRGMSRRDLLRGLGFVAGGVILLDGCTVPSPPSYPLPTPGRPDAGAFPDGVMAGDPAPDGSVIWTRVLPPADGGPVPVLWTVADDAGFGSIRAGGMVLATADRGHCVSVPVSGLDPDRWYAYRFEVDGTPGRTGRLRTAPAPGSSPDRLRFCFAACQQLNDSWFVAHQAMAAEPDLDFLVHLGDYVYVSDTGTLSLDDYRGCYRRWRERPELRDLHAALPTVAMWDDGEFYNGVDRFGDPQRLANAKQAWFEAFPYLNAGDDENHRIVRWGDLADMPVIDVRSHADPYLDTIDLTQGVGLEAYDPARTTLGGPQFDWLCGLLGSSTAAWRLIAQGYPIHPWRLVNLEFLRPFRPDLPPTAGLYIPTDGWDRFVRERRDLLGFLADHGVADTVFCSGQTHIFMASALRPDPDDPHSPVVGFDFVNGSLTADPDPRKAFLGDLPTSVAEDVLHLAERWILAQNSPNLRYMNFIDQGYTIVDVTPEEVEVTYRMIDTMNPDARAFDGAKFRVARGATSIAPVHGSGRRGTFA